MDEQQAQQRLLAVSIKTANDVVDKFVEQIREQEPEGVPAEIELSIRLLCTSVALAVNKAVVDESKKMVEEYVKQFSA